MKPIWFCISLTFWLEEASLTVGGTTGQGTGCEENLPKQQRKAKLPKQRLNKFSFLKPGSLRPSDAGCKCTYGPNKIVFGLRCSHFWLKKDSL